MALDDLPKGGIDRRWSYAKQFETLLRMTVSTLEKGIAAHTAAAQREFYNVILESMGPGVTVGEMNGARNMLTMILDAPPDLKRWPDFRLSRRAALCHKGCARMISLL